MPRIVTHQEHMVSQEKPRWPEKKLNKILVFSQL